MDNTWRIRKDQERERADKKRIRIGDQEDEVKKKAKRMKYTRIEENWGEDEEGEDEYNEDTTLFTKIVQPPTPTKPSSRGTIMTTITDYFAILNTSRRMDPTRMRNNEDEHGDLWMEPEDGIEWFDDQTARMADQYNPGGKSYNEYNVEDGDTSSDLGEQVPRGSACGTYAKISTADQGCIEDQEEGLSTWEDQGEKVPRGSAGYNEISTADLDYPKDQEGVTTRSLQWMIRSGGSPVTTLLNRSGLRNRHPRWRISTTQGMDHHKHGGQYAAYRCGRSSIT